MTEDVKITTKRSTSIRSDYRESTPLSNIDETIIREAELDTLTLGDDPSGIYNKSGPSSKKRKRDINTCEYAVSTAWKKNITSFSF